MKRIWRGRRIWITAATIFTMILLAILAKAWNTSGAGTETHAPMTTRAITLIHDKYPGQYPDIDLDRFGNDIVDGSSGGNNDEPILVLGLGYIHSYPHGHESENDAFDYEKLSQHKWEGTSYPNAFVPSEKGVLDYYKAKNFSGEKNAYWFIGNIAHLTEDMSSPAHAYGDPHGSPLHPSHLFDHMESFGSYLASGHEGGIYGVGLEDKYDAAKEVWQYPNFTRDDEISYCHNDNFGGCGYYYETQTYDSFPSPDDFWTYSDLAGVRGSIIIGTEHTAGMLNDRLREIASGHL